MATTFDQLTLPSWAAENAARAPLSYKEPLPVQRAVVPFVLRAVSAGVPLDVCLSAPTGSGKTLCYCLPMLRAVADARQLYGDNQVRGVVLVPTKALGAQVTHVLKSLSKGSGIKIASICGDNIADESKLLFRTVETADGATRYFPAVDIIVATPQRMMKHIGSASAAGLDADEADPVGNLDDDAVASGAAFSRRGGFPLRYLRMVVIDEADEVLAGSFTNIASQIIQQYETEVAAHTGDGVSGVSSLEPLHKMLCSATLSSHLVKIADVRLHNTKFFTLDGAGNAQTQKSKDTARTDWRVSTKFALPPRLQEHLMIVQDQYRHASALTLVRHIIAQRAKPAALSTATSPAAEDAVATTSTLTAAPVGRTILVFCAEPAAARTLGHFFIAAGISVSEFTSLTATVERRKAILAAIAGDVDVVVTTDALMRGIDLPGVGHVVMYDPPRNLQQYVHRIGRTARAGSAGHSYVLASRLGPSGGLEDGEVAHFKGFDAMLTRSSEVVQERAIQKIPDEVIAEADRLMKVASAAVARGGAAVAGGAADRGNDASADRLSEKRRRTESS